MLETDLSGLPSRVAQVEILLKTDQDETLPFTFSGVVDALRAMAGLVSDPSDISDLLRPQP